MINEPKTDWIGLVVIILFYGGLGAFVAGTAFQSYVGVVIGGSLGVMFACICWDSSDEVKRYNYYGRE